MPLKYSIEMLRATLQYWRKHDGAAGEAICRSLLLLHHGLRAAIRGTVHSLPGRTSGQSLLKYDEDKACIRWLLRGQEPPASPACQGPAADTP